MTYVDRMKQESDELALKLEKLEAFIVGSEFPALPAAEQRRLIEQCVFMRGYADVLGSRVAFATSGRP